MRLPTTESMSVKASCAPMHVVVEPAHERAGLGAGEERERHPLHVGEDLRPHVVDEALADARAM